MERHSYATVLSELCSQLIETFPNANEFAVISAICEAAKKEKSSVFSLDRHWIFAGIAGTFQGPEGPRFLDILAWCRSFCLLDQP